MKTKWILAALMGLATAWPGAQAATRDSGPQQVRVADALVTPAKVVRRTVTRKTTVTKRTVRRHTTRSASSASAAKQRQP